MTFHGPTQYAHQLLSQTMDVLATGSGDVRSRLLEAYSVFHPLTPEHFPEPLRKDFEWVIKQLTKHGPYINAEGEIKKGAVEVSLQHMRNATGVKIAKKLLQLNYDIDCYVNPR